MKLNNKGFSAIVTLLIIAAVGIIGGTGWYVWNQNTDSVQESQTSQPENIKPGSAQNTDNTENEKQPTTHTIKDGSFSGEVTLPNEKTTILSFKYDKTWKFIDDDGKNLTFINSDDVSIILSYSDGGSAPTVPEKVTIGSNKYRKFTWGGDDIRYIRYFLGHESGDFNKDSLQYVSIEGSLSFIDNADQEAEILLSTLKY